MEDRQLLRRFVEQNSQEAFAALTARYLNLVYSVCRRELTDADAAEDVTQAVFLILARKAPTLRRSVVLSGWLFQTARFAARNARLQAQRRAAYEQKAAETMGKQPEADAAWAEIEPVLNRALASLGAGERECILLRFFQGLSFTEAGAALDLSEEAARKRVTRALKKMRRFFGKEGIIVPGVGLAALLSAHAAKAAPATCQASITQTITGVLAGHVTLSLTGSHVYQLSEGVLKAMKFAQIKVAAGVTTILVLGFSAYAVAGKIVLPLTTAHSIHSLEAIPKPGHILAQTSGSTLTAAKIAACCREAYAGLSSYQGTSTVTTQGVSTQFPALHEYHTTAETQFVRPGKIHVEGKDSAGDALAYISDGSTTKETYLGLDHWTKKPDTETAIGGMTGIAFNAATTIPAVLLRIKWGTPIALGKLPDAEIREDNADGQPCYVLTAHQTTPTLSETQYLWIDEKTFLLRRCVSDRSNSAHTITVVGKPVSLPSAQTHLDEQFTNIRLNETIPDSAFALPPTP